jgi:polysaccharide export outer membrane protein
MGWELPMKLLLSLLTFPILFAQSRAPIMEEVGRSNLPRQKIGASDLIAVSVYDAPELTRTIRVETDGSIRLPMLKMSIQAEGLLPDTLEEAITTAYKSEEILVDPIVKVTIVEYDSRPISIAGAVRKPVTFQATGRVTLLEALARAEGLTPDAGLEVLVTQPGGLVRRIPVKALIDDADPEMNIRLAGGEEIRVPEAGKIYVVGNVKRPGAFAVRDSADTSVLKLLALAEGLAPYASKQAYIYRREAAGGSKREIQIELDKIMKRKSPDVPLEANDILYIPDNTGRRATMTTLEKFVLVGAGVGAAVIYAGAR